ncbi:DUF5615 family PIN-like protein [Dankookia rubra]|uniref:DUF5615 family PIN-like protein n=1 Tax=Dankookia rubra TaxID=1442381 RepID=UPI00140B0373|nr:DUF5615 family PIN-like protein [Dankookia rubra]
MSRARVLIDACLTVELAWLAHERGYEAYHLRDISKERLLDGQLKPIIIEGGYCFVTRNAEDFRGPALAPGNAGEYAGVDLHAGLVCIHGPPRGFRKEEQLEAFSIALDLIDAANGDPVNLLIEVTWTPDGIDVDVVDFPKDPAAKPDDSFANYVLRRADD